jgi:hypothetical protein
LFKHDGDYEYYGGNKGVVKFSSFLGRSTLHLGGGSTTCLVILEVVDFNPSL